MILNRLYELALREDLVADPAFEDQPIPCAIQVGKDGEYLGLLDLRTLVTTPAKKKGGAPTSRLDKGRVRSVPRPHGNVANRGFARYFADTFPRVLPLAVDEKDQAKADASRETFWDQIGRAAVETDDPALRAVQAFGHHQGEDAALAQRVQTDFAARGFALADRCTFAWDPDGGKIILERDAVRNWYRDFYRGVQTNRQHDGPQGVCQITGRMGPIPRTHEVKLQRIPGGLSTGVSIVSYDKPAFASYGLDGTENAAIGYEAMEGYLRAVQALIDDRLHGRSGRLRLPGVLVLFWTRDPADLASFLSLDSPEPEQVRQMLAAPQTGNREEIALTENDFFLLAISANAARAVLRDYVELPLARAQENLRRWFADLTIADASRDGLGQPSCRFALSFLARATAMDFDGVAPETPAVLLHAALTGGPVPETLLAACARRLRVEGSSGCYATRMALIKLILLRRNVIVSETLAETDRRPAYVYGRLLRIFEQIQYAALGDVNANVVDKFYGTFSAAPGLVFARLYASAQHHLRKLRTENSKAYTALDRLLTEVTALAPADPPRGQFSLQEQGLFALGYYHQKAHDFARMTANKARRSSQESEPSEDLAATE